jgi:hypothetical protein
MPIADTLGMRRRATSNRQLPTRAASSSWVEVATICPSGCFFRPAPTNDLIGSAPPKRWPSALRYQAPTSSRPPPQSQAGASTGARTGASSKALVDSLVQGFRRSTAQRAGGQLYVRALRAKQRSVTTCPLMRCSWMMRSALSGVTFWYHVPSGYTTQIGPLVQMRKQLAFVR